MTFNEQIYVLVRAIPRGKVLTYSRVSQLLGVSRGARAVGWALNGCATQGDVPWQRVINAQGKISPRELPEFAILQRERLEAEGVQFGAHDVIDLDVYLWQPSPLEIRTILENAAKIAMQKEQDSNG
jgi:methylated-DNA-protein-cysteine methyltransferase related protein